MLFAVRLQDGEQPPKLRGPPLPQSLSQDSQQQARGVSSKTAALRVQGAPEAGLSVGAQTSARAQ